mmetsp:Transcript_35975/g.65021  ORF Transcript_35975/g.65021 Transcript_35975/m.65021 type:complete len:280 (+) Transcript_35975:1948-2787(+)
MTLTLPSRTTRVRHQDDPSCEETATSQDSRRRKLTMTSQVARSFAATGKSQHGCCLKSTSQTLGAQSSAEQVTSQAARSQLPTGWSQVWLSQAATARSQGEPSFEETTTTRFVRTPVLTSPIPGGRSCAGKVRSRVAGNLQQTATSRDALCPSTTRRSPSEPSCAATKKIQDGCSRTQRGKSRGGQSFAATVTHPSLTKHRLTRTSPSVRNFATTRMILTARSQQRTMKPPNEPSRKETGCFLADSSFAGTENCQVEQHQTQTRKRQVEQNSLATTTIR